MWECSNTSGIGGMLPGGLLLVLLAAVVAAGLIFVLIRQKGQTRPGRRNRDRTDSVLILDVRYASGEISRDDYLKMKRSLEPPPGETACHPRTKNS